jgi:HTH-type transcriptional regulator, sugar sensing transcriptional regulator
MDDIAIMDIIKKAGFSEYEAKCYLALLERDSMSVNDIAKLAGIPRPSTYDVLEQLMAKGLVTAIPGKTKRYAAADPQILREKSLGAIKIEIETIDKQKAEILIREKEVQENIDGAVNKLQALFGNNRSNGSPLDYIEIVKGANANHRKFIELCSKASKGILAFAKPPFAFSTPEEIQEQGASQNRTPDKSLVIKSIYELTAGIIEKYPLVIDNLNREVEGPDEVRVVDQLPMKMVIFDENVVFLLLEDPIEGKTSFTGIVIKHQALALGLKMLFDAIWANGKDYYEIGDKKFHVPNPDKTDGNKINKTGS